MDGHPRSYRWPNPAHEPLQVEKAMGRWARRVEDTVARLWVFSFITVFRNAPRTVSPNTV